MFSVRASFLFSGLLCRFTWMTSTWVTMLMSRGGVPMSGSSNCVPTTRRAGEDKKPKMLKRTPQLLTLAACLTDAPLQAVAQHICKK